MERSVEGSCSRLQEPELPHGFWCSPCDPGNQRLTSVAVGTGVTSCPPRRSRRAAFPHRAPVEGQTHSGLGLQFRSVDASRRGHAGSGSVSGACVGPCPSFDPSLHALRHQPVGRRCSRLHRYYAAVRLLRPSGPASAPRLPEPVRDRRGGCGRPEISQVPTRSLTPRTGLRWSASQNGPAHVACDGL